MKLSLTPSRALQLAAAIATATLQASAAAQSGSIGYGSSSPGGPRAIEEQSAAVSYSSRASACGLAKSAASDYAKRKPNMKDMSIGNCECSVARKALWLPQQQAQYSRETGQSIGSTTPVDVHECTVSFRVSFK
ncbi:hypothetical protein [Variovorax sp. DAIF25]|uniref:hypothetical protein n=1 Tax=Variovorax sp. DAIF25 TaxID=3080983 RepID=UPI003D6C688A